MSHAVKLFFVDNSDYDFCYECCLARVLVVYIFLNVPFDVTLLFEIPKNNSKGQQEKFKRNPLHFSFGGQRGSNGFAILLRYGYDG